MRCQHYVLKLYITMNDSVSVEVLQCLANLKRYKTGHVCWNGLKLSRGQILLQVAPCHVLHHDAMLILTRELLFKPDNIRAVFTLRLQFDFAGDLLNVSFVHLAECD